MFNRMPKYSCLQEAGAFLSAHMHISTDMPAVAAQLRGAMPVAYNENVSYKGIFLVEEVPPYIVKKVEDAFGVEYADSADAYTILADEAVTVYAKSKRGLLYGALTVVQMAAEQYLRKGLVYEAPVCEVRGAKVYLPGRAGIPYFKEFIDLLCHLRMNTLMIEIGGAMEYKRHPEINEGWVEYCEDIGAYSARSTEIQEQTFTWLKNSIHVENGEGSFLTQDEVRDIADYCRERYIEIIPEVPSHSHCDYLLLRHPEIRERANDPYADTFCPSDERSYALLFDVVDEVNEVFKPRSMNMGHDECYTIGVCEKCKGKNPVELYANDIIRINDYLKSKNVEMIIWGEKLINAVSGEGRPCGGAAFVGNWCKHPVEPVPAIYPCADILPNDICILHWYWGMPDEYDEEYHKRGFPMMYGNFAPRQFKHWRRRMERGIRGGIMSNWSSVKHENLQRNGMLFDLAYASHMFWDDDFGADKAEAIEQASFEMLYAYANRHVKTGIRITHSTDYYKEYAVFCDGVFILAEEYDLGSYTVTFEDGRTVSLPIEYGMNISSATDLRNADNDTYFETAFVINDKRKLHEVAYTTLPKAVKTGCGYTMQYETTFALPEGCGGVSGIVYVPNPKLNAHVTIHGVERF